MLFDKKLAQALANEQITEEEILGAFEVPKDSKMGDICLPCFKFSRTLRKAPPQIATELSASLENTDFVEKVDVVGGYLNIHLNRKAIAGSLIDYLGKENIGGSDEGKGKTICIDYSSVNIAKPFHIGHLSTTVIGGALYRIFKHLGYNVVGINHLGDWGTQFGKLIVATRKWSSLEEIAKNNEYFLNSLYVRYHQESENNPALDDEARAWFKRIEDGDSEAVAYFDTFKDVTMRAVSKIYDRLKITFDSYNGESFYNDKMQPILDELEEKGLLEISDGAKVVNLEEYSMPPCLLVKADGASLYATRDIAAAYYRKATYDFHKCLYVVAYQQNLHFKQVFKTLELMDFAGKDDVEHVAFGMVSMEDGSMSTRQGRVVWLQEVLDKAVEKARAIIEEKNPNLEDKAQIAESVGVGAVVFSALWNNRIKDIVFSYDKVLNFDGETSPYVQYTYARSKSALRKGGQYDLGNLDLEAILDDDGYEVVKSILTFGDAVKQSAKVREPSVVTRHIVDLAEKFNRFYIGHRIVVDDERVKNARLMLTDIVGRTIKEGLALLGIDAPEVM